jgi:hypothetical protein
MRRRRTNPDGSMIRLLLDRGADPDRCEGNNSPLGDRPPDRRLPPRPDRGAGTEGAERVAVPFSESQFNTLEYRNDFPERFDSVEHARTWCAGFFDYLRQRHRHSAPGLHTPRRCTSAPPAETRAKRAQVIANAYAANPNRFGTHRNPRNCRPRHGSTHRATTENGVHTIETPSQRP